MKQVGKRLTYDKELDHFVRITAPDSSHFERKKTRNLLRALSVAVLSYRLRLWRSTRNLVHDFHHVRGLIQDVKVNSGGALFDEFSGLGDATADADFFRFGRVITGSFEFGLKFPRQAGAAHRGN